MKQVDYFIGGSRPSSLNNFLQGHTAKEATNMRYALFSPQALLAFSYPSLSSVFVAEQLSLIGEQFSYGWSVGLWPMV